MYRIGSVLIFISLACFTYGQVEMKINCLPNISDSIVSSLSWTDYHKIVIKSLNDTVIIRDYIQKSGIDTSTIYCDYIIPIKNIRLLETRINNDNAFELEIYSMSDGKGFFTECQPKEFRSYSIPLLNFYTNVIDS